MVDCPYMTRSKTGFIGENEKKYIGLGVMMINGVPFRYIINDNAFFNLCFVI